MFITQGFFQRGGGHLVPISCDLPPPLGHAENFILYVNQLYKGFNDIINGKFCLCENSPRFHQIVSTKKSKIKIPPGPMLTHVCYMLVPPKFIRSHFACPLLGEKLKETQLL